MQTDKLAQGFGRLGALHIAAGIALLWSDAISPVGLLVDLAVWFFIIGFIGLGIGGVFWLAKAKKAALPTLVVSAIIFMVGIGGALMGFAGLGGTVISGTPPPPPGYIANWDCNFYTLAAGGPGGAHDAITEFPDAPFVAADGGTPDLNKVIATPLLDLVSKKATVDVSVDDDVTTTAAAYIDEDAYAFDVRCFLTNPTPAVGGGRQEIPLWGKISVTRTTGTNNNGSFAHIFYGDVTAGYYLGLGKIADSGATPDAHDADHTYVSYTKTIGYPNAAPLEGDWIQLGTSDGDEDGEWIAVWYVLDTGYSDYTSPPVGNDVVISIQLGTDPNDTQYVGNLQSLSVELNLLART